MFGWLSDIFDGIVNGFATLIEGVLTLVESLGAMFAWIPQLLSFASGSFLKFIPNAFLAVVSVLMVIFICKLVLGGSNK